MFPRKKLSRKSLEIAGDVIPDSCDTQMLASRRQVIPPEAVEELFPSNTARQKPNPHSDSP